MSDEPKTQDRGDAGGPPEGPTVATAPAGGDGFPRELYAPAVEGRIIRPKSKPRIVRGDDA